MSLPAHIGRYQIVGHLASGGMAQILLGKLVGPSGFERPVVIKRILPHLTQQESFRKMFLDEARVVARMQHPNVVRVNELGTEDTELFMVMEYLEGESLLSLMRRAANRNETIDRPLAAHLVSQACGGLHAAHELTDDQGMPLNLVHRDVSPHNIFVTYDGAVKVLDFGIAKFAERQTDTEAGQLKGKFPYMSPEQCVATDLDRRSDIFSLGTVLFELTTGRRLFSRETSLLTMKAITEGPVPSPLSVDPDYPRCLARIVEKALQRDPRARYQTAADMRRDLVAAVRELAFDEVPEEALSRLMTYLFSDRVGEKKELLRRVSSGSQITNVPAAEVDVSVELPTVFGAPHKVVGTTPYAAEKEVSPAPPGRRWPWVATLAAAVVLAAGVGIGFSLASPDTLEVHEAATATTVATSIEEPAPVAEPDPTPAPPPEPAVEEPSPITVAITSVPSGATVTVDGETRGVTPLDLEMAVASEAVVLSVSHDGFEPFESELVPDRDLRVVARLRRERRAPRPRATGRASMTAMTAMTTMAAASGSPFRRFN